MAPLRQLDHYNIVNTERDIQIRDEACDDWDDSIFDDWMRKKGEIKAKKSSGKIVPLIELFQTSKVVYLKENS